MYLVVEVGFDGALFSDAVFLRCLKEPTKLLILKKKKKMYYRGEFLKKKKKNTYLKTIRFSDSSFVYFSLIVRGQFSFFSSVIFLKYIRQW